jgi:hypothetical protein
MLGMAGPAAYAVDTAFTAHSGAGVSAGPALPGGGGFGRNGIARRVGAGAGGRPRGGAGTDVVAGGGFGRQGAGATSPQLTALLETAGTRWSAATVGSSAAASLELASKTAVMGVGGFTGADPAPSLAQFQADVASGQVRYFVTAPGNTGRFGSRGGIGVTITQWVQQHYTPTTVAGATVYNLTAPA